MKNNQFIFLVLLIFSSLGIKAQVILDSTVVSFLSNYQNEKLVSVTRDTSYWRSNTLAQLLFSENYYKNWNAGGDNAVTSVVKVDWKATYNRDKLNWENMFKLEYGLNRQQDKELKKTNDLIEFTSIVGYEVVESWYASSQLRFTTQLTNGYDYHDDAPNILKSSFFAPAKVFIGVGAKYTKDEGFYLYFSPFTENTTFVMNEELAKKGDINRNKEKIYNKIGPWLDVYWNYKFYRDYAILNKVSLYSDYIHEFGSLDYFDWQVDISMPLHKYFTLNLNFHTKYEKDILFDVEGSTTGEKERKIQFRQSMSVGLKYEF